jgi:hypothetical protein
MKNRSLFWPLALIATGVLWILVNMGIVPPANLWALASYWPILLIALGIGLILRTFWEPATTVMSALVVVGAVVVVLFAPQLNLNTVPTWSLGNNFAGSLPGSGKIISQTREVDGFQTISIRYPAEVTIQQGSAELVTVTADDNLLPQLSTATSGGTLTIKNTEANWGKRVNPSQTVKIKITVKDLRELDFSAAGDVSVDGLKTDTLKVSVSGAGTLTISNLAAGRLDCNLSGAGTIRASGAADDLKLRISGVGSFEGGELHSQAADAGISGAGSAKLWVERSLEAQISGTGSINYYGAPATVTKHVSGLGSINSVGSK